MLLIVMFMSANNSGTIINISYVEGVDINKSLEENLMQTEKDFATLQKVFENLNVSVSNPEIFILSGYSTTI